mgnify:CR=1 FL=1
MPFPPACSATLPRCAVNAKHSYTLSPSQRFYPLLPPSFRRQFFSARGVTSRIRSTPLSARPGVLACDWLGCAPSCHYRPFSGTRTAMAATNINGTQIAKNIRAGLKEEIQKIQESNPRFKPSLVIYQGACCCHRDLPRGQE